LYQRAEIYADTCIGWDGEGC